MSSILITSRLHRSWKRSTKQWAHEMRRVSGSEGGFTGLAPRPSQAVPPPEEFGSVLRAVLPYINHGVNASVASAIIAAGTAGQDLPHSALFPLAYYSGLSSARGSTTDNVCLTFSREWVGCPLVPMEDFPMAAMFADEVPPALASFPRETHEKIVFTAWHGVNLFPKGFANLSELTEAEAVCVHARELERISTSPGLFVKPVVSNLRYTGCVRAATDAEIDTLFDTLILPERWLKSNEINFRDFFNGVGVEGAALTEAADQADALLRASPTPIVGSSPTDVPASRRPRRATEDDVPMAGPRTVRPPAPGVNEGVDPSYRMFNGSTATARSPRRNRLTDLIPPEPPLVIRSIPDRIIEDMPMPSSCHFESGISESSIAPGQ